jgi:hypothetical protein
MRLMSIGGARGLISDHIKRMARSLRQEHDEYQAVTNRSPKRLSSESDTGDAPTAAAPTPSTVIRAFVLFSMGREIDDICKMLRTPENPLARSTVR